MNHNVTKKFIATFLAIISIFSLISIQAFAKNNEDRAFAFTFYSNGKMDYYTTGLRKEDDSGTYLKYNSGTATSAYFRVFGSSTSTFLGAYMYNETKGDKAFVWRGQEGCIRQYVYENRNARYNGTPYAFLQGTVDVVSDSSSTATGVWSPDTLGSYTYFN